MLFVQEHLAHLRGNIVRAPHLQTSSKLVSCVYIVRLKLVFEASNLHLCPPFQNFCVERMWVEINGRVNYPLKTCLVEMEEQSEIDLESSHVKFCVSWFTIRVSNVGTTLAVQAWNDHPISGRIAFGMSDLQSGSTVDCYQDNPVQGIKQSTQIQIRTKHLYQKQDAHTGQHIASLRLYPSSILYTYLTSLNIQEIHRTACQ